MKATVVPAQVTTVEDRIFANLGLSQVLLMLMVIIVCSAIYTLAPPTMEGAAYKYFVMGSIALVCGILAIRIKVRLSPCGCWCCLHTACGQGITSTTKTSQPCAKPTPPKKKKWSRKRKLKIQIAKSRLLDRGLISLKLPESSLQ